MNERVVVIGHGAREHALAFKLANGASCSTKRSRDVIVLGGNAGIAQEFECIDNDLRDIDSIVQICKRLEPELIVIGPEFLLAEGLADRLRAARLRVFGPTKKAAALEASKYFAKRICDDAKITTAGFEKFTELAPALSFVDNQQSEAMVVKVDALCAGKGVVVCHNKKTARATLRELFEANGFARLGVADKTVIIEDYLDGSEVSVFGLANNENVAMFCPMQDWKRLNDFDEGPNTGGMGAFGPLGKDTHAREVFLQRIKEKIFLPALSSMARKNTPFSGLLYAGLMLVKGHPYLLEFNVRFGDPETQALLFGSRADIFPLLKSIASDEPFDETFWQAKLLEMDPTIAIVCASEGYPFRKADKAARICLPPSKTLDEKILFAATGVNDEGELVAESGRILSVVARAPRVDDALRLGYETVRNVEFAGMHYRRDIGNRVTILE